MKKFSKNFQKKRWHFLLMFVLVVFLITLQFVSAAVYDFQKLAKEFQKSTILDFISFSLKGERYPLMHAISELRFRVFSTKLGIKTKSETKSCSQKRTYGIKVPENQKKLCSDYDTLVDLAKDSLVKTYIFQKIYQNAESLLLYEIERQRARDAVRIWIRQKIRCLKDEYRCGRDERKMVKRLIKSDSKVLKSYIQLLVNLEKKLFPEEQIATFIKKKDIETPCGFNEKSNKKTIKPGMVMIPSGSFKMGSNSSTFFENTVREVNLSEFWIDKCEVTNYQFLQVVAKHPFLRKSTFPRKYHDGNYLLNWDDDLIPEIGSELKPVVYVSWYAARHYCNFLGKRLLSEAEWEMATRAGIDNAFSIDGGVEFLTDYAWFSENSDGIVHTTGQKFSNPNGIFDLHGNVWEWVYDWFGKYSKVDNTNPQGPSIGKYRILRGGSWRDPAEYLRSSMRRDTIPISTFDNVGFRCASE